MLTFVFQKEFISVLHQPAFAIEDKCWQKQIFLGRIVVANAEGSLQLVSKKRQHINAVLNCLVGAGNHVGHRSCFLLELSSLILILTNHQRSIQLLLYQVENTIRGSK